MGGTKIIVFQLKEIIRTAIFALIGLILIIVLIFFFLPKKTTDEQSLYIPGTYTSKVVLHNNTPVNINVTVSDNQITDISLENMDEVQEVFYPLFQPTIEEMASEIIKKQSLDIELSKGNYYTSQILLDAVRNALIDANNENADQ